MKKFALSAIQSRADRLRSHSLPKIPAYTYRGQEEARNAASSPMRGVGAKKASPVYTGTAMLGIGTLHKSNAVPIFSEQEAEDISKMRR